MSAMPFKLHLAATCREKCRVDGDFLQEVTEYLQAEGFEMQGPLRFEIPGHCVGHRLRNHDVIAEVSRCDFLGIFTTIDFHTQTNLQSQTPPPTNPT